MIYQCEVCKRAFSKQAECQKHEAECKTTNGVALDIASTIEQMICEARAAGIAVGAYDPSANNECAECIDIKYDHDKKAIFLEFEY